SAAQPTPYVICRWRVWLAEYSLPRQETWRRVSPGVLVSLASLAPLLRLRQHQTQRSNQLSDSGDASSRFRWKSGGEPLSTSSIRELKLQSFMPLTVSM